MYFSPTGTTRKIVEENGNRIIQINHPTSAETIDFTLPKQRETGQNFKKDDLLLIVVQFMQVEFQIFY